MASVIHYYNITTIQVVSVLSLSHPSSPKAQQLSAPRAESRDPETTCTASCHEQTGAAFARPARSQQPMRIRCAEMISAHKCFVNRSAGFSSHGTFSRQTSPPRTRSCTHRSLVSRCRTRPMPVRLQIPIAADESTPNLKPHCTPNMQENFAPQYPKLSLCT